MMQTYHVEMDDGKLIHVQAVNAGTAIQDALQLHLEHKAVRCFAGGYAAFDEFGRWIGEGGSKIEFEIPVHQALTAKPKSPRPSRQTRGPAQLFNDETILSESARAKGKFDA